jgi:signal transduction histidine kinase
VVVAGGAVPERVVANDSGLLLAKYSELANKLGVVAAEHFALAKLSSWITQSRLSGLALVENSRLVLANARFNELGRGSPRAGRWCAVGGVPSLAEPAAEPASFATLGDLVVGVAEQMQAQALPPIVAARFKRERSDQAVDVRLELGQPHPGEPGVVLALIDDVTRAARDEAELGRARQALLRRETLRVVGEIASGVAHDLANLFSAMQMRAAVMRREPGISPSQRERLDGLSRILTDGTGMLTRLQDFARVGMERPAAPLDLVEVIREAVEMACTSVTEKAALAGTRISIVLKLPALPRVLGIAADLRQMFINLLLNARDAMPRGGRILISAHVARGTVVVKVEDEGSGVPPEIRHRIFDTFFTTKGERGTGLGLSIAYELMNRLGGSISVANRRQGGAAFTLRFPEAPRSADSPELAPVPAAPPATTTAPASGGPRHPLSGRQRTTRGAA